MPFVYQTVSNFPNHMFRCRIDLVDGKVMHTVLTGRTKGRSSLIEELLPGDAVALEQIKAALEDPASFGQEVEARLNQVFRAMNGPPIQWFKGETG